MTSLYAGHNIPEDPAISHLKPTGGNTPSVYQKLYHGGNSITVRFLENETSCDRIWDRERIC